MRLVIVLVIAMLAACGAHDVHVRYPALPDQPTGTIVLLLSKPADGVSVAVGGMLVVDDVHTQRVVIANAPTGTQEIMMTANGGDKQFRIWVDSDHATTVPMGVPESGTGFLKSLFGTLVTIVAYSLLR